MKEPKTRKSKRSIFITDRFATKSNSSMESSIFQDEEEFVFYSTKAGIPITNAKSINNALFKIHKNIGIDEDQRQEQHIVFHSLRHFFNTYLKNDGIPGDLIREYLGHSSLAMTENYTHRLPEDFKIIRNLQEGLGL